MSFSEKIKLTRQLEVKRLEEIIYKEIDIKELQIILLELIKNKSPNNFTRHLLVNYPNIYLNVERAISEENLSTVKFMEKVYRIINQDRFSLTEVVKCNICKTNELKFHSYPLGYGYKSYTNLSCPSCNKVGGLCRFIRKYGEEIGEEKYKNYLNLKKGQLGLQWFVDKFGDEGETKYEEYWSYNFSQRKRINYSKISQELFWKIYNNLPEHLKQKTMFAELNKEKRLNLNKHDKIIFGDKKRVCFFMDFCIGKSFCIEFDGKYWHKESEDKDLRKDIIIESKGYKIIRIKEEEYLKNKEEITNKCLNTLREFYDFD